MELTNYSFNYEFKVKLDAFPDISTEDVMVQSYIWFDGKKESAVRVEGNKMRIGLRNTWPWQEGLLEQRVFMRRHLYTHMDRHVESKSVERKQGSLPFRPVLSLVAVTASQRMRDLLAGKRLAKLDVVLFDAQRKSPAGQLAMTNIVVSRGYPVHPPNPDPGRPSWREFNDMTVRMTTKAVEQQTAKTTETNITELPRRAWSHVWTPTGVVPLWMWVWAGIEAAEEATSDKRHRILYTQLGDLSGLLMRQSGIGSPAEIAERQATNSCLAARHMAYLKDMIKSPEIKRDQVSDFWTFPWHSPDMATQEIDCEDGAIMTLALETSFNKMAGSAVDIPAFAILTLRPPTDGEGKQWTYHAVCLRLNPRWLGYLDERGTHYAAMLLDTSASHECLWEDKPRAAEYAAMDRRAIPPEAAGFAMHRNTWREVKDAKIYGHVQTIVFKHKGRMHQYELTWKGKLGVPVDVLMDTKQALSADVQFVPLDLSALEETKVGWAKMRPVSSAWGEIFRYQQPDLPVFAPPKDGVYLGQSKLRRDADPRLEHWARMESGPDPQYQADTKVTVSPLAQEGDAMFTVRRADFSAELLELVKKHNVGKQVLHHDITLMGDIACTLFIVR